MLDVENVKIEELSLDPANVRLHSDKNLSAIKSSLKRFGQQKPIVVSSDNIVIAGNGTLTAAISLGWTAINIVRTKLKGAEATAYGIADNRTSELANWDDAALGEILQSLSLEEGDLFLATGFTEKELKTMLDMTMNIETGEIDSDEFKEFSHECPKCGFGFDD